QPVTQLVLDDARNAQQPDPEAQSLLVAGPGVDGGVHQPPPEIGIACPVTEIAASLTSHIAAAETSSGVIRRWLGLISAKPCRASASLRPVFSITRWIDCSSISVST